MPGDVHGDRSTRSRHQCSGYATAGRAPGRSGRRGLGPAEQSGIRPGSAGASPAASGIGVIV
eukprot:12924172-Prorocentrum_lima.AAC.1